MSYKREVIINTFQELIFKKFGKNLSDIKDLKADASDRKIYRLFADDEKSIIGIHNENKKENLAFINFTKTFVELGFRVPEILSVSDDNLFYIEEDLGDITLYSHIQNESNSDNMQYFKQSLEDLLAFQIKTGNKIDYSYCYQTEEFNSEVILSDFQKFEENYTRLYPGINFNNSLKQSILDYANDIFKNIDKDFFLYRDFQPRNIMLKDTQLYYIDYQSGRKGPLQYDVASFLFSGSINISEEEREILLDYYLEKSKNCLNLNKKDFLKYFYFFVFQRLLQMLGSYAYLYRKRNNNEILKKIPKALVNMKSLVNKIDNLEINEFIRAITNY